MQAASMESETNSAPDQSKKRSKKAYKFKPGTVSLRQIKKMQQTTNNLIPRKSFYRLVKEILSDSSQNGTSKFTTEGINALQNDTESFIVEYFKRSQKQAIHAGRKTIHISDTKEE